MSVPVDTTGIHSLTNELSTDEENATKDHENGDQESEEEAVLRYPLRDRRTSKRFMCMAKTCPQVDMPTLKEAMNSKTRESWKSAIKEELRALEKNKTREVVQDPGNVNVIPCKGVLRFKRDANGVIKRHKARLVVCSNKDQTELSDTFAPLFDFSIVRLLLSLAARRKSEVHQVDYSSAFLQGKFKRDVYMRVPEMINVSQSGNFCELKRTLCGLREAPGACYKLSSKSLGKLGLIPMQSCACVFKGEDLLVLCYVDDLLIIGKDEKETDKLKRKLKAQLPANDMGKASDFLGMGAAQYGEMMVMTQSKYIDTLVTELGLEESSASKVPCDTSEAFSTTKEEKADESFPYRELIGSLLYIATYTRPDIAVVTSMLARHIEDPSMKHQRTAIKVVKYLKGLASHGLKLQPGKSTHLHAYVDANCGRERRNGRRSRTGIVIFYGSALICYRSALQKCVTLSSTEAEYVSLSECTKTINWLRRVLEEIGLPQEVTTIFEDNARALKWATSHIGEEFRRSKHVDIRYHHVREQVNAGVVCLEKIDSKNMVADFLTKPLSAAEIENANRMVGVCVVDVDKSAGHVMKNMKVRGSVEKGTNT